MQRCHKHKIMTEYYEISTTISSETETDEDAYLTVIFDCQGCNHFNCNKVDFLIDVIREDKKFKNMEEKQITFSFCFSFTNFRKKFARETNII